MKTGNVEQSVLSDRTAETRPQNTDLQVQIHWLTPTPHCLHNMVFNRATKIISIGWKEGEGFKVWLTDLHPKYQGSYP